MEIKLVNIARSILKEDVSYTKEKSKELLDKYEKDLDKYKSASKVLYGKFSGFTLGDLLEESGINDFKRISDAIEKFSDKVEKDYDSITDIRDSMYNEYDDNDDLEAKELYKKAGEIQDKYQDIQYGLEIIEEFSVKIYQYLDHLTEYKKLKHLKDFQQGIK